MGSGASKVRRTPRSPRRELRLGLRVRLHGAQQLQLLLVALRLLVARQRVVRLEVPRAGDAVELAVAGEVRVERQRQQLLLAAGLARGAGRGAVLGACVRGGDVGGDLVEVAAVEPGVEAGGGALRG